ncbi:MAG: hypothetical protein V1773_10100 [bacterium]
MKKYFLLFFLMFFLSKGLDAQVAVIANKSVPVDRITKSQLLDYYSGDIKYWPNSKPIIVFDLKPKLEVKDLFYEYIAKNTARMKSIWMKRMLSGDGDPPESVNSEEEMCNKVENTPGSIGFISLNKIKGNVKTIAIIK